MSSFATEEQSAIEQLFAAFAANELPLRVHSQKLVASQVMFTGTCYVTSIQMNNTNASVQYGQIFDASVVPADGAIPDYLLTLSGLADKFLTFPLPGLFFRTGVVMCNSSTAATKTVGSADCFFHVQYVPVIFA